MILDPSNGRLRLFKTACKPTRASDVTFKPKYERYRNLGSRKNTYLWSVKIILICACALCQIKTIYLGRGACSNNHNKPNKICWLNIFGVFRGPQRGTQ